ncbi:hypothetical protein C0J52_09718, partial [Blattella germanica]
LPTQVCNPCVQQVNQSYNFKQRCENTDIVLRKLFVQMQENKNKESSSDEMPVKVELIDSEVPINDYHIADFSTDEEG